MPYNKKKIIKIGTRDSNLALKQVKIFIDYIKNFYENLDFEIIKIKTSGDLILNKPLYDFGGKALFTKEIDQALLNNSIDIGVHSAKDIDSHVNEHISFPLILKREDPSDCLISFKYKNLFEIPFGGVIGTCSLRRKEQILLLRPDLNFEIMRGNIDSRIKKLQSSEKLDAIILASAGLIRMNMNEFISSKFNLDDIIPSPCQGIISIACLKENKELIEILSRITEKISDFNFRLERKFIETLNASCKAAIGCYSEFIENNKKIKISCIVLKQKTKIYKKIIFILKL